MQYCGLMTLCTPVWVGMAAKLAGRMLANPVRYFRKVDRSNLKFADPIPDMKHIYVENAGVRLHAATHGLGSGKPLMLFLHGFPETWATWRHQLKEFAGQYELVAMDLRGYGGSDAPKGVRSYTVDKVCSDVAAVIAATGNSKAIVVGQDWGGGIAWLMSIYYPQLVAKLVVITCPHPAAYKDPERFDGEMVSRQWYTLLFQSRLGEAYLRHGDFREIRRWMTQAPHGALTPGAITEKELERYKAAFSRPGSLTAAINYYRASFASTTKWWTAEVDKAYYTFISAPTLLLYADKDSVFLPKMYSKTEELVDHLTTVCLDNCSHWANQDRPDLVNQNIAAFLAGKLEAGNHKGRRPKGSMVMVKAGVPASGTATPAAAGAGGWGSLAQVPKQD